MSVLDAFLIENRGFVNYQTEHFICFTGSMALIAYYLYQGRNKWDVEQQRKYVTFICLAGAFTQLFKFGYRLWDGSFNPGEDMPLHLCNIMVLVMPIIMWTKNKTWWGITFFWIMAGCAQSIFTPTLTESLPHYEAVRYWLVHAVIILGALYGLIVYRFDLTLMDALRSAIGLNILAAVIFPVNNVLGANYMYLNRKPPGQTFYDLLGPWPDYILVLEFVVIVFFGGILLLVRKLRAQPLMVK